MAYLATSEYGRFGLEESVPESLAWAASDLIDAHCRRKGFEIVQYMERFRMGRSRTVRLSYLPLAAASGAASAIVLARGRYRAGVGDGPLGLAGEIIQTFAAPALWIDVPLSALDVDAASGEVIVCDGLLSPALHDLELTYTAGYSETPWPVKQACARLMNNALATPALNVAKQKIDSSYLQYFSDSLLDADVLKLLAPFVSQRLAQ
jgi:hypothetical protein